MIFLGSWFSSCISIGLLLSFESTEGGSAGYNAY